MKNLAEFGYNERLFSGGLRTRLHLARFRWLQEQLAKRACAANAVLELGCFDGKLIDFLPARPSRYVGFDADWEGALDLAAKKWGACPDYVFLKAVTPQDMRLEDGNRFDIAVVMETLEHVPPELVDGYLRTIAQHLDGYLFVTVPNEKGLVFLGKWLAKKLLSSDAEPYTPAEFFNTVIGRTHLVARYEHKGFDYERLISEIERYFDVLEVSGHPFGFLPPDLCFGVGIVAKTRANAARSPHSAAFCRG